MNKKHQLYKSWFLNLLLTLCIISLLVFSAIIGVLPAIKLFFKASFFVGYRFEIFWNSSLSVCLIAFLLITLLIPIFAFLLKRFINNYYYQRFHNPSLKFSNLLKKEKILIANGTTILLGLIAEISGILMFNHVASTTANHHYEINRMWHLLLLNISLFNNFFLILFILFFTNWESFKLKLVKKYWLGFNLLLIFNQNHLKRCHDQKKSYVIIYNHAWWSWCLLLMQQWWQIKLNKIKHDFKNIIHAQVVIKLITDSKAQNQILF